jgi:hypothetical protein
LIEGINFSFSQQVICKLCGLFILQSFIMFVVSCLQIVECNYLWRCYDSTGVEEQLADELSIRSYSLSHAAGSAHAMHVDPLASQMELVHLMDKL